VVREYQVVPGPHFGTVLRGDADAGPPDELDDLADPVELIDIWVFDSWVMNIDRRVYGNILLGPSSGGKLELIPADQSDCFGGAGTLASGEYLRLGQRAGAAAWCPLVPPTILRHGAAPVRSACDRVHTTAARAGAACERVPETWWEASGVEPDGIVDCLTERARRIEGIVDVAKWEALPDATDGGRVLGL